MRRHRGQALIEFAVSFPFVVMLLFILWMGWLYFARQTTYTNTASATAEIVSRSGGFDAEMAEVAADQLNKSNGMTSDGAFLFMVAVDDLDAVIAQCGTPAPEVAEPDPTAPADTGWESCQETMGSLPGGTRLEVDVWGYQRFELPVIPIGGWSMPTGHAVTIVLRSE